MRDPITLKPAQPGVPDWASDQVIALPHNIPTVRPVLEDRIVAIAPIGPWQLICMVWRFIGSVTEWVFGAAVLFVGLAVLAAIPILQFLSLGYLLECSGRIARTGKLREGFIGMRQAARIGSIILGTWLLLLPIWLVSSLAISAQLIEPNGAMAIGWKIGQVTLSLAIGIHIVLAWLQGGKLRHFAWPIGHFFWLYRVLQQPNYYQQSRDAVWNFVVSLRLPYYFWLGGRGFFGSLLWLLLPVTLVALSSRAQIGTSPGPVQVMVVLCGLVGIFLLIPVVLFLPFLQVRFAAENRMSAMFDVFGVLRWYVRAPWAFSFSFFITLLFAVPLYLLRIEMIPRDTTWSPGVVFVFFTMVFIGFIYPARMLTGWACGRASRRESPRHWVFYCTGVLPMPLFAFLYVMFIYLVHFTTWEGIWSLYQQHAFLLPVPFMQM